MSILNIIVILVCNSFAPVFVTSTSTSTFKYSILMEKIGGIESNGAMSLDEVRDSLIRQEDTIVFKLIERARYKMNGVVYDENGGLVKGFNGSLLKYFVMESEAVQSKVGRYESPEENPFFPDDLPPCLVSGKNTSQVLYPAAASVNINKMIWDMYINELLPLFIAEGDDNNYGSTALADLECLQALSRRIHYGKFVAEVKFRDSPQNYGAAIHAQDRDALMKMLTFKKVEEMVKRRVEKKAMVFGQEVCLDDKGCKDNYKIDPPSVVSRIYGEWVMPLTKLVEVEYLLRRLD